MNKLFAILIGFIIVGCGDENYIPKPPSYLRLELPDHTYHSIDTDCPYSFELADLYTMRSVYDGETKTCHKDIDLGPLKGTLHFSYIQIEDPLINYVNFVNDKVDEHKIKASAINDYQIIDSTRKVYGAFFELQGDVASPFQFYLTDSTTKFVSAVVYFNSVPNYDSLKPSLDYLKLDLDHLIKSFNWRE